MQGFDDKTGEPKIPIHMASWPSHQYLRKKKLPKDYFGRYMCAPARAASSMPCCAMLIKLACVSSGLPAFVEVMVCSRSSKVLLCKTGSLQISCTAILGCRIQPEDQAVRCPNINVIVYIC